MDKYKDPAFLFYPADFLVGTMDMSDEEVGQYIRLMCRQHQKGHLPATVIERTSDEVKSKFIQDEDGKWYNKRLEKEIEKRAKYTASRRRNLESNKDAKREQKKEDITDLTKVDAVPMPDNIRGKLKRLGVKIGEEK
jgi:uncharacterized protein YdaU (DUF1376 family)